MSKNRVLDQVRHLCGCQRFAQAALLIDHYCESHSVDADTWYVRASVHAHLGNLDQAIDSCRRVLIVRPRDRGARYNLAVALQHAGRLHEARDAFDELLTQYPDDVRALRAAGTLSLQLGNLDQAVARLHQAASKEPADDNTLISLADVLHRKKADREALKKLNAVSPASKSTAEYQFLRGVVLYALGRHEQALDCYRHTLNHDPRNVGALNNLGHHEMEQGRFDSAVDYFQRAVNHNYKHPLCHLNLAIAQESLGHLAVAVDSYKTALSLDPACADAAVQMGFCLTDMGRYTEADAAFIGVLATRPGHEPALAGRAMLLHRRGQNAEALDTLAPCLASSRLDPQAAQVLARVAPHIGRIEESIVSIEKSLESVRGDRDAEASMRFALGELYDKSGEYDRAFTCFRDANRVAPGHFDSEQHRRFIDDIRTVFSPQAMPRLPRSDLHTQRPVFIVGMPRSGTTLIEQILSAHPDVYGAGELTIIGDIAHGRLPLTRGWAPYPAWISRLDATDIGRLTEAYLNSLPQASSHAVRTTDKMPHNFLYLGLIEMLFPDARVIHVNRDPRDNCLSLYFQRMNPMHAYTQDLRTLGTYYIQYESLMRHWNQVVGIPMFNVRYEDVINHFEETCRSLITFCGLKWDARCLAFHDIDRAVNTPSYDQVRRPIYRSSVDRWKHYKAHVSGLVEALHPAGTGDF